MSSFDMNKLPTSRQNEGFCYLSAGKRRIEHGGYHDGF